MTVGNFDWHQRNLETYNKSAQALADYFKGIGARTDDINTGLKLANAGPNARVIEIGCGDGRDAEVISQKVGWYEGVDPSSGLLAIARRRLPDVSFVEADALTYEYPENLDVIFAFASLLHVRKDDLSLILQKAHAALRVGGLYYISLKEREEYAEEVKRDEYGERMFYYYNPNLVTECAGNGYRAIHEAHQTIGHTNWFTLALEKC